MHKRAAGLILILTTSISWAETWVDADHQLAIDPEQGADRTVDYGALVQVGPWDDRNYELTREDLAFLGENEADLRQALPAFFRVLLRKELKKERIEHFDRYPLSALNVLRQNYGGYLVEGTYYRKAVWLGNRFYVRLGSAMPDPRDDPQATAVEGEVKVTSPEGAAESAIAINPVDLSRMVAGTNGPLGGQRMHFSNDGGNSWTQVNLPLGATCCDPTVEWSTDGQFAYAATLGGCSPFCGVWFYRSDNAGVSWTGLDNVTPGDPRREISSSGDREFLHVDQSAASPRKDNIYLTWHNANILRLSRSLDFGNTWSTFVFSSASAERGIAGDIATDRVGNVYFAWPALNSLTVRVRKSTDGGATFAPTVVVANMNTSFSFPIPAVDSRQVAMYLASDADTTDGPFANSVYLVWTDTTGPESPVPALNHARVQVAASHDGGQSWNITNPHETADQNSVDRWQPFIAVGPDGIVHVIFYDTRNSPDRMAADLYYAFSSDGAATWSIPQRITTEMSPNINDGFEFGDYSGLDIVMSDLVAIFTDNRNESGGAGDSVDVYAAGITPGAGATAGAVPGSVNVPGPPLILAKSSGSVDLDWSDACGPAADYAVYVGNIGDFDNKLPRKCSTEGATSTSLAFGPGNFFYLVVPTEAAAEGSYGRQSDLTERTPSSNACLPQAIELCR